MIAYAAIDVVDNSDAERPVRLATTQTEYLWSTGKTPCKAYRSSHGHAVLRLRYAPLRMTALMWEGNEILALVGKARDSGAWRSDTTASISN
jgi:hypothetical protein